MGNLAIQLLRTETLTFFGLCHRCSSRLIPQVLLGSALIHHEPLRYLLENLRGAQVSQTVMVYPGMKQLPLGLVWILRGFGNVQEVSVHVHRDHHLFIHCDQVEGRILLKMRGSRPREHAHSNVAARVLHGGVDLNLLIMVVTIEAESDNMLVTLKQGLEADTPAMHALIVQRRDVSDQDSCPTYRLKVCQLLLEPFKLVAWVVPGL